MVDRPHPDDVLCVAFYDQADNLEPHIGTLVPVHYTGADVCEGVHVIGSMDLDGMNCRLHSVRVVTRPDGSHPRLHVEVTRGPHRFRLTASDPVRAEQLVRGLIRPTSI
jgi:hypothetical protein